MDKSDSKPVKKLPETKAEAAASFGKSKEKVTETPFTYEERVYNYKDGSCRVRAPRYTPSND